MPRSRTTRADVRRPRDGGNAAQALLLALLFAAAAGCDKNTPVTPIVVPPLDSIRVTPDTLTVRVGGSGLFTAIGYDTLGASVGGVPADWTTSDSTGSIVTIDSRGRARGVSEGTAWVFAEVQGLRDSAVVVVEPAQDGWYVQPSSANGADLHGVFFLSDARTGWAVGAGGKILHTTDGGAHWAPQTSNTSFALQAIWFTSALKGWAVGLGGTVLHTVNGGASWTRIDAGTAQALYDVCFSDGQTGSIAGSGVILTTDDEGDTWSLDFPTAAALYSISFSGANGWAVGAAGTIVGTHDYGTSWFVVQPFVTSQTLNAVWRRSEEKAWAAGAVGSAPRTVPVPIVPGGPDSTGWQLRNAGAQFQLQGIHFPTDALGFAVGQQSVGLVLRTVDGGLTWQTQVSNSQFALDDVFFVDDQRGWAVGANGTIIHTGTGGER
jgi:photosystem II stability/assembly factor-like uncharacterized protein